MRSCVLWLSLDQMMALSSYSARKPLHTLVDSTMWAPLCTLQQRSQMADCSAPLRTVDCFCIAICTARPPGKHRPCCN
ncbi:hypothetical protein PR003_g14408 [Phytophthora rubi]|uniref:Uncharacterized protein n=1 Tax=Phytophthora rubi TaxID=129364 RepID=A0A6A3LM08_9STRA|nr:hypothetical protein PR002_g13968 [Phytophthora rubi]KAE9020541.1 hypothetical protein PR001_g13579 [Phytophthora rubi]KAE9332643.1 hypothetical protein PR003_g14408 [Phytophthora rubi]